MKILVIEDDPNKAQQVISYLKGFDPEPTVVHKRSYQSGLKELYDNSFDFVILDMSLPTYDTKAGEDAYKFRHLAGYDILKEIKRKKKVAKVVIVTQFERFGEGKQFISLRDLKMGLRRDFPDNYKETISYHPNGTAWKKELEKYITFKNTD